jgi:hypothetical protein
MELESLDSLELDTSTVDTCDLDSLDTERQTSTPRHQTHMWSQSLDRP